MNTFKQTQCRLNDKMRIFKNIFETLIFPNGKSYKLILRPNFTFCQDIPDPTVFGNQIIVSKVGAIKSFGWQIGEFGLSSELALGGFPTNGATLSKFIMSINI